MRSKLEINSQNEEETQHSINTISHEDRTVWFIWIGLLFIAVAALPFVARSPNLVKSIADLCLSLTPL